MTRPKFTKTRDTLTEDVKRKIRAMQHPEKALMAMGTVIVSLAKRAFNEPEVRALPWDPLKPGTIARKKKLGLSEAPLKAHGTLMRSPRVINVSGNTVTVGSDRPYAAYQQLGTTKGIPPRPFFPVKPEGQLTDKAAKLVKAAAVRALNAEMKA